MKNPISLYFHIPFCKSKCLYCHFATVIGKSIDFGAYFTKLNQEIDYYLPKIKNYQIQSIYFGGGTPSLVDDKYIANILLRLNSIISKDKNIEITIELNPESVTLDKLNAYKKMGINRLSMGVQSLDNKLLRAMGRLHLAEDVKKALQLIEVSGFDNYNLDLIFGLPNQSMNNWKDTLDKIVNYNPNHISCYTLELDNNSAWGKLSKIGKFKSLSESLDRKMYDYVCKFLSKHDYEHYEISNFAKKGFYCRHNYNFWQMQPYLGMGVSAGSYFEDKLFTNPSKLIDYLNMDFDRIIQIESKIERMKNFVMLQSRLISGINRQLFYSLFQQDILSVFGSQLIQLEKDKYLTIGIQYIKLTDKGLDLWNQVAMEFV